MEKLDFTCFLECRTLEIFIGNKNPVQDREAPISKQLHILIFNPVPNLSTENDYFPK